MEDHVAVRINVRDGDGFTLDGKLVAGVEVVAQVGLAGFGLLAAAAFAGEDGGLKLGGIFFEGVGDLVAGAVGKGFAHGAIKATGVAGQVRVIRVGQIAEKLVEPQAALLPVHERAPFAAEGFLKSVPLAAGGTLGRRWHASEASDVVDNIGGFAVWMRAGAGAAALGNREHVESAGRILADGNALEAGLVALHPRLRRGGIGERDCGLACRGGRAYLWRTADSGLGYCVSDVRRLVHAGSLGRGRQGRRFGQAGRGCHHRRVIHGSRGRLWRGDLGGSRGGHGGDRRQFVHGRRCGRTRRHGRQHDVAGRARGVKRRDAGRRELHLIDRAGLIWHDGASFTTGTIIERATAAIAPTLPTALHLAHEVQIRALKISGAFTFSEEGGFHRARGRGGFEGPHRAAKQRTDATGGEHLCGIDFAGVDLLGQRIGAGIDRATKRRARGHGRRPGGNQRILGVGSTLERRPQRRASNDRRGHHLPVARLVARTAGHFAFLGEHFPGEGTGGRQPQRDRGTPAHRGEQAGGKRQAIPHERFAEFARVHNRAAGIERVGVAPGRGGWGVCTVGRLIRC